MESNFDLQFYLAILRRRFLYLLLPATLVAIAGVGFAFLLPPAYQASATILVESQQIPTDLASPTVTADAAERVRAIEQRLLTRDNLLQIADKFGLYQGQGGDQSKSQLVENMRKAIRIDQIDTAGIGVPGRVVGFTVKFEYRDASTASIVTNELVTSILSQNVQSRLTRASETSDFFAQQKTDLEQRLLALEQKLAEFKRTNEAVLPETLSLRREQLEQVRIQMNDVQQKLRVQASNPSAAGTPDLQQLSFSLQAKQLELDSLREQRAQMGPLSEKGMVAANTLKDLDRQIAVAEINIKALQAQIANVGGAVGGDAIKRLNDDLAELEGQSKALVEGILQTPAVEVELNSMNRDYENLQVEYRQAQARLENAQTGERLEEDRQSERFEVIEQATPPDRPASPDRPKIMIAGFAGGIAAGIALIVLRQFLDKSIYTASDLERALQFRPIATVPYLVTPAERSRKRWRVILFVISLAAAIVVGLIVVDRFYLPLDLLMERVTQRIHEWLAARGIAG